MVVHVRHSKGKRDRDLPMTPKLLETLREYWRWMKPKTYLFPGMDNNWRVDKPLSSKAIYIIVRDAAKRAGITKPVSPHCLRHYSEFRTMPSNIGLICAEPGIAGPRRRCAGKILGI